MSIGYTNKYTQEYFHAVALGKVPNCSITNKSAKNSDVDTGAEEDIIDGGGDYAGQPAAFTAETIECFSASANDTSAGTGARTVKAQAMTAAGVWVQVTFTLNGATPVVPDSPYNATTFVRCHTAFVDTAGSGGFNAGIITIRHTTTTANIFQVMTVGRNQTYTGAYTVPDGYVGLLIQRGISVINATAPTTTSAEVVAAIRDENKAWRYRRPVEVSASGGGSEIDITGGIFLQSLTDIKMRVMSVTTNNTIVCCYFDIYIEPS